MIASGEAPRRPRPQSALAAARRSRQHGAHRQRHADLRRSRRPRPRWAPGRAPRRARPDIASASAHPLLAGLGVGVAGVDRRGADAVGPRRLRGRPGSAPPPRRCGSGAAPSRALGSSQTNRPTSVLPPPFSPHGRRRPRKPGASCAGSSSSTPAGGVTQRDAEEALAHSEPLRLVEAQHQVEVLDALAGGALPDVVDRREGQHPPALLAPSRRSWHSLVSRTRAQVRRAVEDPDEGLAGVALLGRGPGRRLARGRLESRREAGRQLTLVERQQVRHEGDRAPGCRAPPAPARSRAGGDGPRSCRERRSRSSPSSGRGRRSRARSRRSPASRVIDDLGEQAPVRPAAPARARSRSGSSRGSRPASALAQLLAVHLGQPVDAARRTAPARRARRTSARRSPCRAAGSRRRGRRPAPRRARSAASVGAAAPCG